MEEKHLRTQEEINQEYSQVCLQVGHSLLQHQDLVEKAKQRFAELKSETPKPKETSGTAPTQESA